MNSLSASETDDRYSLSFSYFTSFPMEANTSSKGFAPQGENLEVKKKPFYEYEREANFPFLTYEKHDCVPDTLMNSEKKLDPKSLCKHPIYFHC